MFEENISVMYEFKYSQNIVYSWINIISIIFFYIFIYFYHF